MDCNSDGNDEFTAFLGIITSSEKEFELTDEIEAQFYSYCKKIIFNVIEPLLLALCDRPLHDEAQSSSHAKAPNKKQGLRLDVAQFEFTEKQQYESEVFTEPKNLLKELKGLEADLKSIFEVRKCLLTKERNFPVRGKSEEVIRSLRGIHGTMMKLRNGIASSLEDKRNDGTEPQNLNDLKFQQLELGIAASIREIDSLFEKLGNHQMAKNDVKNELILCYGDKKVNKQHPTEKREQSPDGDCSSFLSAQDFGFIPDEKIEGGRFCENFGSAIGAFEVDRGIDDSSKICGSMKDSTRKYVPIRASSSMLEFEYSTSSDEDDESSTSSKIQFDRTMSNTSSVVDIESHEESFPTEKCMQPKILKIETEKIEPSAGSTVSKDYLERSSRLSILKRVDNHYIEEAREVFLNVFSGQEIESEKLIANFSQTGLELIKFTYKDPLEEVAETLLSGPLKDIDIEDIFDCRPVALKSEVNENIDHGAENDLNVSVAQSCANQNFNSNRAVESNEPPPKDTGSGSTCEGHGFQAKDMAEKKTTQILQIVKMLRTIINTLKSGGMKKASEFSTKDNQSAPAERSDENVSRHGNESYKVKTLLDYLLEELFKKILIKKFEQKMKDESRISSDESLNQMLFDLNQSDNTTPHSFSDDAFEDFKSNSPSATNSQCVDFDNISDKALGSTVGPKETEIIEPKSMEIPGTSECVGKTEKTEPGNFAENVSKYDQFCEQHISDICSVMMENPGFLHNPGKIEVRKFTENGESLLEPIKKVSIELLLKSEERLTGQTLILGEGPEKSGTTQKSALDEVNKPSQLDFPGAESDKSAQPSMQSNATELVEEEVDFNEQIRYLGQQIVDIEKYLSDFESEEKIAEAAENPTAGTSEDSSSKLTGPGKHCPLSPEAPPEKAAGNFCSENTAEFSDDKILNVIQMTDESNTSIKISDQNLLKECGFLTSVGSSDLSGEDFSSSLSESFDYNSFTTTDNFVPRSELPVKDVFYANLVMPRNTTSLVFSPSTQNKSKFRYPDGAPRITESESAQHLVFTRDALSKIIKQEADALEVDVPLLSVIKGGNSKDFKVRISEDTNFDVKLSKSDFESLVTAVKISRPSMVAESAPRHCDSPSAEMLIHRPNFKTSITSHVTGSPREMENETSEKEVAHVLLEKGSLMKILSSIIGKAKSVESKETKEIVMNFSDSSLDGVNISKAVRISSSKVALGKILNNLLGFPSKNESRISKSQTSTSVSQKLSTQFDCSLSFSNLRSTFKAPEHAQMNMFETTSSSSTDNVIDSKTEEHVTQSAPRFKFGFAASSGMVNQRPRVDEHRKSKMFFANSFNGVRMMKSEPNRNFTEPTEANNDVLSASSLSNFSESLHSLKNKEEKSSASSSESSITDRLFSASSSSLPGNETTASVLALEPNETIGWNAPSSKKMAESEKKMSSSKGNESFKPSSAKHEALVNNLDSHRAAFKLIESCEQILNCKRRSDEIRSRSFNKANNLEGKSLVTVLKTVDKKFVDRMSSCGATSFGKNIGSRPGNDVSVHNADSSELEEKNTRYDLIVEATEASENDTEISRGMLDKEKIEGGGLLNTNAQRIYDPTDVELTSGNSSDTSYETTLSEVFYDLPTVDSDLAYYLEIERNFTVSCAEIERSIDESRGAEIAALEMKISRTKLGGKKGDHVRKPDFTSGCVKKEIPLKGKGKINRKDSALKKSHKERQETAEYLSGLQTQNSAEIQEEIETPKASQKHDLHMTTSVKHDCVKDEAARKHLPMAEMHENNIANWFANKLSQETHETESLRETTENKPSVETFEKFSVTEFCRRKKVLKKQDGIENKANFKPRTTKHVKASLFGEEVLREKTCSDRDAVERAKKSCKQNSCKKHRSMAKDDSNWLDKRFAEIQNESVRARDSLRRCLSCKRVKATKKDSKMKAKPNETSNDPSTLERQLNLIHDSLRLGARMHSQFYENHDVSKYSPKTSRFENGSLVREGFQESAKNQHNVISRSRFTRNHNCGEDSVDSTFESSSQSEVSRRTFRSDGEKVSIGSPTLNANTLMEFFERVYGVYDHIRQCHSCKALMSQIIEEVISDLAVMRRSQT